MFHFVCALYFVLKNILGNNFVESPLGDLIASNVVGFCLNYVNTVSSFKEQNPNLNVTISCYL